MTQLGLGAIPSPPDARDWPLLAAPRFAEAPTTFPLTYGLPPLVPTALDQDGTGRCVGYGTTHMKNYQEHLQTGQWFYDNHSADLLYERCKQIDGMPDVEGTYPRVALDIARREGLTAINRHHYTIAAYYSLLEPGAELDNIKKTLVFYKRPVLIATNWFNSWFRLGLGYTVKPPAGGIAGGHLYLVWGYVTQPDGSTRLRCLNSWGLKWGNKGRFYMPWDYVKPGSNGGLSDLWASIDR